MSGAAATAYTFITFDLSGILAPPQSVRVDYQTYWNTFERIQAFNSNVSTIRASGDKTPTYYQFVSTDEKLEFTNGRMLHIQRYPASNWSVVQPD